MSLRAFFLPTAKPDAGGVARLGRVLYWVSVSLSLMAAAGVLAGIISRFLLRVSPGHTRLIDWEGVYTFAFITVMAWLIGRACRYVLAGE